MDKNPDEYIDFEEKAFIKNELKKEGISEFDEKSNVRNKSNISDKSKIEKKAEDIEPITQVGRTFKNTIDNVFEAGLLDGENDDEEAAIIKQRQKFTLNYLNQILEDVKNYLSQIAAGKLLKASSYDDNKKYQSDVQSSDEIRRIYHNRLIGDIRIASRLINVNFNADFPNDLRIQEESRIADRKKMSIDELRDKMAKRKYFKFSFPSGSFIDFNKIPKDYQGEREYIANWAFKLYSDLSILQKEVGDVANKTEKEEK